MAQTVGVLNGTNLVIYVDGNAVGHATTHSITISDALRSITTKDSAGWEESLQGLRSWSLSGDGMTALDASYTVDDLTALITARTSVTVRFSTNNSGDQYWTGSAILESLDMSSPLEDSVTYSFSLKGTAALTNPTFT
tara:strand:- start:492 stop:905 length:414 start_codon:yes stop_codon:yes gene_type:complete